MLYRFTIVPIVVDAPTEEEAWDELFHDHGLDPDSVDIEVECIGECE